MNSISYLYVQQIHIIRQCLYTGSYPGLNANWQKVSQRILFARKVSSGILFTSRALQESFDILFSFPSVCIMLEPWTNHMQKTASKNSLSFFHKCLSNTAHFRNFRNFETRKTYVKPIFEICIQHMRVSKRWCISLWAFWKQFEHNLTFCWKMTKFLALKLWKSAKVR